MKRFALIGGIYSNWRALETALSDIARRQVDVRHVVGGLGQSRPGAGIGGVGANRLVEEFDRGQKPIGERERTNAAMMSEDRYR